jgi:hypothetical protein
LHIERADLSDLIDFDSADLAKSGHDALRNERLSAKSVPKSHILQNFRKFLNFEQQNRCKTGRFADLIGARRCGQKRVMSEE